MLPLGLTAGAILPPYDFFDSLLTLNRQVGDGGSRRRCCIIFQETGGGSGVQRPTHSHRQECAVDLAFGYVDRGEAGPEDARGAAE